MSRLIDKGFTARAPQTAASVPELPDFNAELAALPGGQETNAALQRWWDIIRQRIEFNNGSLDQRISKITASFDNGVNTLQAQIAHEEEVRADADSALGIEIDTVSASVDGVIASVTVISSALATATSYLESRWTVNVTAGPIVTGMTLFSASGPDTNVSYISFQADRFQINTASGGNKQIFSATATEIKLGSVLTVDLAGTKLFIGTGTYANANTYFYVDTVSGGRMSLGDKFVWDGSTLTITGTISATTGSIGGWTVGATTLTGGNATLDSAGQLFLGTSNDIVYLSATNATYRLWVGNVTAGSAAFSVTKTGVLSATGATISGAITATSGSFTGSITSTSGTIGGWTIASTTLTGGSAILDAAGQLVLGTSNDIVYLSATNATYRLWVGNVTAGSAAFSVTKAGVMFATGATVSGTITITNTTSFGVNYAGAASPGAAATSIVSQGALATLNSASWTTQVGSRPTELTDGRITTAISSAGLIISGVKPGIVVSPGGIAGLYLGSDFLGYYNGSTWRTYMDSSGNFYLGGTSGALQWNGTTLSITGSVTITNPTTFGVNYAGAASPGAAATSIVGQAATATSSDFASVTGATKPADNATVGATWGTNVFSRPSELTDGRITTAINSSGLIVSGVKPGIVVSAGGIAGLYLGSDFLGYYNGSAWKTYMDNSGNFYLGGTSGSLQWNGSTLTINGGGTFSGALSAASGTFTGTLSAATGSFSGAVTSTSGTIGGFTIGSSTLSTGAGYQTITMSTSISSAFTAGDPSGLRAVQRGASGSASFYVFNSSNTLCGALEGQSSAQGARLTLNNTASSKVAILDIDQLYSTPTLSLTDGASTATVSATGGFTGIGSGITQLNASNLSSGTIDNARLSGVLLSANNLSELSGSASTARSNLGLGSIATQASSSVSISGGTVNGCTSDGFVYSGVTGSSRFSFGYDGANWGIWIDGTLKYIAATNV